MNKDSRFHNNNEGLTSVSEPGYFKCLMFFWKKKPGLCLFLKIYWLSFQVNKSVYSS